MYLNGNSKLSDVCIHSWKYLGKHTHLSWVTNSEVILYLLPTYRISFRWSLLWNGILRHSLHRKLNFLSLSLVGHPPCFISACLLLLYSNVVCSGNVFYLYLLAQILIITWNWILSAIFDQLLQSNLSNGSWMRNMVKASLLLSVPVFTVWL